MQSNNTNGNNKNNDEQYLFNKEINCPVCGVKSKVPFVKIKAYRIKSKDSDLYINYSLINPYFYDVWLCNECGYAAMKSDFEKIRKRDIDIILKEISPKWKRRYYPMVHDVNIAIELFKLSLLNNSIIKSKSSIKAMNCLKLAWMYRILKDNENEQLFLKQSLNEFKEAYFNEDFPIYGMDKFATMYLIGELYRRTGNYQEALIQFSNVITNPHASRKVKDLAITQKDLIKGTLIVESEEIKDNKEKSNTQIKKKQGLFSTLFN